jgi:uncharacterized membrane protein
VSDQILDPRGAPAQEEKVLAALAHVSIFFLPVILPVVLYVACKDRSTFVKFHALQAAVFHAIAGFVVMVVALFTCGAGAVLGLPVAAVELFFAVRAFQGEWQSYPGLESVGR